MEIDMKSDTILKYALAGDAAASGATGLLAAGLSGLLAGLLGLPESLLTYAGLFLVAYAGAVAFVALRARGVAAAVWTIIVLNLVWVADSAVLLVASEPAPTLIGHAFVIFQAVAVLGFAVAQIAGVRGLAAARTAAPVRQ
jgi:hypothetical protein